MTAPDVGYTPDPADVELAARAISLYDWDHQVSNNPEIGEHQRNEARAVLSALAATGRLLPADAETRTEYGVRMVETSGGSSTSSGAEYGRPTRENAESSAAFMRTLPGVASTEIVWRTTWVGPWLPAPTTEES